MKFNAVLSSNFSPEHSPTKELDTSVTAALIGYRDQMRGAGQESFRFGGSLEMVVPDADI